MAIVFWDRPKTLAKFVRGQGGGIHICIGVAVRSPGLRRFHRQAIKTDENDPKAIRPNQIVKKNTKT